MWWKIRRAKHRMLEVEWLSIMWRQIFPLCWDRSRQPVFYPVFLWLLSMRPVTQGGQSGIDFVQCWPSHFCASRIGHFFFEFRDVCWFRFLSWDSSISTSLVFLLFAGGVRISWKKWCWKGRNGSWNFIPCHLTSFKLLMLSFTFWWILGPKKPDPSGMLYVSSWIVL